MIKAVHACVLSTALYGAEAWWPCVARITTRRDKGVSTDFGWHTGLLDKTTVRAVIAALPALRTTPNSALRRELGIPPTVILLSQRQLLSAARIRRLDVSGTEDRVAPLYSFTTQSANIYSHKNGY